MDTRRLPSTITRPRAAVRSAMSLLARRLSQCLGRQMMRRRLRVVPSRYHIYGTDVSGWRLLSIGMSSDSPGYGLKLTRSRALLSSTESSQVPTPATRHQIPCWLTKPQESAAPLLQGRWYSQPSPSFLSTAKVQRSLLRPCHPALRLLIGLGVLMPTAWSSDSRVQM